ncbi:MAG: prepilin-type N-terminal cleavage/methylation domain-containing protein [Gammaproteobacteria bacterium]|nr:prepilin-type N-terminal cleavage/methylation domain-containing protein [Gammaproteobacteria bacterium]
MKKNSGFTLLELMIILGVVSILMMIAIPSMTTFSQNDRLTTNINSMVGHLAYARSEALKLSQQVVICSSNDAATCSGGWADGWIVYIDADADNSFTAGEVVIRAQQALGGSNTLTATGIGSQITYDNRGFVNAASIGSLLLCDDRTGPHGKRLRITATGRVRLETDISC